MDLWNDGGGRKDGRGAAGSRQWHALSVGLQRPAACGSMSADVIGRFLFHLIHLLHVVIGQKSHQHIARASLTCVLGGNFWSTSSAIYKSERADPRLHVRALDFNPCIVSTAALADTSLYGSLGTRGQKPSRGFYPGGQDTMTYSLFRRRKRNCFWEEEEEEIFEYSFRRKSTGFRSEGRAELLAVTRYCFAEIVQPGPLPD